MFSVQPPVNNTFIDAISMGEDDNEDEADCGSRLMLRRTAPGPALWLRVINTGDDTSLFDDGTESMTSLIESSRAAITESEPLRDRNPELTPLSHSPWASSAAVGAWRLACASERAQGGSLEDSSDKLGALEGMVAYFTVLEDWYPVTACSPRFASFVGPPGAETRLLDLVVNAEAFITQAQAVFSRAYHSSDLTVSQMCANVCLKPPRTSTKHRRYRISAHVEFSMDHNSSADDFKTWTVRADFHDVLWQSQRPRTDLANRRS